ncbi:hypothetical protein BJV74DRAFT_775961 [Russula compacta]|nr:hypothetical protein BJV74DRAFT_775961 [Russula compacta]
MQFFTVLLSALALAVSTTASPTDAAKREELLVVAPPIISPNSTSVWSIFSTQEVIWDTSNIPSEAQNATGTLLLGYLDGNNTFDEHLNTGNPLASGFRLTAGRQSIFVPDVPTRDTYIVVLVGDSGDKSEPFTIFRRL